LREVIGVEDRVGRAVGQLFGKESEGLTVAAADVEEGERVRRRAALGANEILQHRNQQFALIGAEHVDAIERVPLEQPRESIRVLSIGVQRLNSFLVISSASTKRAACSAMKAREIWTGSIRSYSARFLMRRVRDR
jgi:hypothetical protein